MAFAGVDLHMSYCHAIVCTREGDVLKEGRIPTDKEDLEEFFFRSGAFGDRVGGNEQNLFG